MNYRNISKDDGSLILMISVGLTALTNNILPNTIFKNNLYTIADVGVF